MPEGARKRGVTIFLGADAADNPSDTKLSEEQMAPLSLVAEPMSLGIRTQVLVPEVGGFSLKHLWLKPSFPLPRHHHTPGPCMYYVICGEAHMGNQVLRAGDSFLVPGGAPYAYTAGPEGAEVLEIRYGVSEVDMTIVEDAERYRQRAHDALEANRELWEAPDRAPTITEERLP